MPDLDPYSWLPRGQGDWPDPYPDLPRHRQNVWIARRSHMFEQGHEKALRWYQRQRRLAAQIIAEPPVAFYCWNRACCLQGCLAEMLENAGIPIGTIEWGCLPETLLVTTRRQNFRGWRCPDPLPPNLNPEAVPAVPGLEIKAVKSLYSQKPPSIATHSANSGATPRVVYLGFSEVDSFAYPAAAPDTRTFLPFSRSCLDLAGQIAVGNPQGVTVFKPHPQHNGNQPGQISDRLWTVEGDPAEWIAWADIVVSTGTKLELEAARLGKPVICVGGGLLWGSGLVAEVRTLKQLHASLAAPPPAAGHKLNPWINRMAGHELISLESGFNAFFHSIGRLRKGRGWGLKAAACMRRIKRMILPFGNTAQGHQERQR